MSSKIFISHKTVDRRLASQFKTAMIQLGLSNDDVFISEETSPGQPWHPHIFEALRSSDLLLFLYTDPSLDWDWCLFECGYFAGLPDLNGKPRSLICINAGIGRPSPLNQWQDVSSPDTLKEVLTKLANLTGSDYPERTEFSAFVTGLWNSLVHHLPQKTDAKYHALQQRRMSVTVDASAMRDVKLGRPIRNGVKIEISDGAREIFANAPLESQWDDFSVSLADWQKVWAESIGITIRMLNGTRTSSPMLPLVRSNTQDGVLFRPSVIQRDFFRNNQKDPPEDTIRYTIIFIRTPDATMPGQGREDRLYHWLMLARNFREAIIELFSRKADSVPHDVNAIKLLTQDLLDEAALIRIDSSSRGLDLNRDMKLFCNESARSIRLIMDQWDDIDLKLKNFGSLARGLPEEPPPLDQIEDLVRDLKVTLSTLRDINEAFAFHVVCAMTSSVAQGRDS